MPQYTSHNQGSGNYQSSPNNGYGDGSSPSTSHQSHDGNDATLISRTQKQHTTQQVTTTTKTIREIQYLGPDGQLLEYVPNMAAHPLPAPRGVNLPQNYEHIAGSEYDPNMYQAGDPSQHGGFQDYDPYSSNYVEYPHRAPTPPSPSDRSASPPPQHREPDYKRHRGVVGSTGSAYPPPRSGYDELDTTLMPPRSGGEYDRGSPGPMQAGAMAQHFHGPAGDGGYAPRYSSVEDPTYSLHGSLGYDPNLDNSVFEDQPGQQVGAPRAIFDEDERQREPSPDNKMNFGGQQRGIPGVHWRDPDLHEVIEFLSNPNSVIKANAAAYLQHLCYMDDPVKAKTRQLGGIPPLVALLTHDIPEIHRNACGALRNLSYGRQNDENKRAIKNAGGIPSLVRLLRKTTDNEVKELVAGVLWNLSSCDDLKRTIIDEALLVLVNIVIIPHSGWDPNGLGTDTHWSTVFRNGSGILRNISSAGDYGRKKLRECEGLVDSLVYLVKKAIEKANIDNKSVENCVCVLRNLSYRAQEVEDPNYDKKQLTPTVETRAGAKPSSDNLGCFNSSKTKRKESGAGSPRENASSNRGPRNASGKGMDLLWQPEVVQPYLNLLSNCSNPETLEASAGAIQNLSACYWQPSIDIRAAVRKEKGLPILVELLRMEVDRVVCAVATALRNLAIDQRNKELIGKYAMRDLVQKLPSGNPQHDHGTSDDTIAAVLATLNEVIKKHPEFSRSLLEAGGVDRLMTITRQRQRFSSRVVKFAGQVLYSMWQHQELREVYRKAGWNQSDFVTKTVAARNARPNSPTNLNSTLNRPMGSQSGTRYEDRTMQRGGGATSVASNRPEEVQMQNLSLYGTTAQPGGNNHLVFPGEPVYAQVNRDKKKNSRNHQMDPMDPMSGGFHPHQHGGNYSEHSDLWQPTASPRGQVTPHNPDNSAGGDSWV